MSSKMHFYILSLILLAVFLLTVLIITKIIRFKKEKEFIMMELGRCEEDEIYYWKRELKKLYISMIPVIGWFYVKKNSK